MDQNGAFQWTWVPHYRFGQETFHDKYQSLKLMEVSSGSLFPPLHSNISFSWIILMIIFFFCFPLMESLTWDFWNASHYVNIKLKQHNSTVIFYCILYTLWIYIMKYFKKTKIKIKEEFIQFPFSEGIQTDKNSNVLR